MVAYADTSFLVSLYLLDVHSQAAARLMRSKPSLTLTPLSELELTNALELAIFRCEIDSTKIRAAQAAFRQDVEGGVYSLRPLPEEAFQTALRMARKRSARLGTRTLDILHVACALLFKADRFFTFDKRQRRLARAEGLRVW